MHCRSTRHVRLRAEKTLTHEAISEVAVLGLQDEHWGEVGVAVRVYKPGVEVSEAELIDWMGSHIARYKVPKRLVGDALERRGVSTVLAPTIQKDPETSDAPN